jgi:tetratricopeptide (TPR) repeat protein
MSEARRLVEQAKKLYEPWDLATADDFALAEQLLTRAIALDPGDADAWAASALVACASRVMGEFSETSARLARSRAEKAIKLAPEAPLARFAWAFCLRFDPQTQDEAVRLLREEAARQPTNRFVVRTLGAALRGISEFEQSLVYFAKSAALPGNDPITHYNRGLSLNHLGRFDEAEAAFDEALAIAPHYASANFEKLNLLLDIRRDVARAQAHLAKISSISISNQATAVNAYGVAILLKQPERALELLRGVNEFINGAGPKATMTAVAHRMAGNEEAARTDLKAALRLVEERLAAQPNDTLLIAYKAEALALLGDRTAAESLLRELRQRIAAGDRSGTALNDQTMSKEKEAALLMLLNQPEAALAALEARFGSAARVYRSKTGLRYDPIWDPLRGNPRFEALLNAPDAKK